MSITGGVTFRPAVRKDTPLIIGLAGPTKSGKTYSAHRLARGIAGGAPIAMINAEGARGHQYAEKFQYLACDLEAPFRATRYVDALKEAAKINPGCVIVDSVSHCHDGPGGALEWHEEELDRLSRGDQSKRDKNNFTAWIKPKTAENALIYQILSMQCPVILCMRAKEKLKIIPGRQPENLGWQPIVGERIAFETIFTLMLPPHAKGVPDLSISEMREPFDSLVPHGRPIDEKVGEQLASWARGGSAPAPQAAEAKARERLSDAEITAIAVAAKARASELGGDLTDVQIVRAALDRYGWKTRTEIDPARYDEFLELVANWSKADAA